MKLLILIIFIVALSSTSKGQFDIFPDSFPNVSGLKYVTTFTTEKSYYTDGTIEDTSVTTYKYLLDTSGKTIARVCFLGSRLADKNLYKYSNGLLVSNKNYDYIRGNNMKSINESKWDSILLSYENWDSTQLSRQTTFSYGGNRLIYYSEYVSLQKVLWDETNLKYDSAGRIIWEEIKRYYYDSVVDRKEYSYKDTVINIKYYRNNVLKNNEEIINNNTGKVLQAVLKGLDGKIQIKTVYKYNSKMQLIETRRSRKFGFAQFGDFHDMSDDVTKTIVTYDESGRLILKKQYRKFKGRRNLLESIEKYEYSK